jgi:hypothetical protein
MKLKTIPLQLVGRYTAFTVNRHGFAVRVPIWVPALDSEPATPESETDPRNPNVPGHEGAGHTSESAGHTSPPTT